MLKELALMTLDEALRQSDTDASTVNAPRYGHTYTCRPPAPSLARLPSRTREYVLPPRLLPGPLCIIFR
jgi:hypothetical protein